MKSSISHLPKNKQQELKQLLNIIHDILTAEMVILFGSYSRGDWVEDTYTEGHITYEYQSDYDILIIVKDKSISKKFDLLEKIESRYDALSDVNTPLNCIMHHIEYVNSQIEEGRYFFIDIKKEGTLLYDSKKYKLVAKRKLDLEKIAQIAREDFDQWFFSAKEFLIDFRNAFKRNSYKKAAFELHQAAERFYQTILLVFTGYKPKTHNIERLSKKAKSFVLEIATVFPKTTIEERRLFELLKNAYLDARYNKEYVITREELDYLGTRVEKLQHITEWICRKKLNAPGTQTISLFKDIRSENAKQSFSEYIKELRLKKNLSVEEVSKQLAVPPAIICKIESAPTELSDEILEKIAKTYVVNLEELKIKYLGDKISYQLMSEENSSEILKAAEQRIDYLKSKK